MAWYDPRDWSGDDWGRVGLGVATGGLSEVGRALSGNKSIYDWVPGVKEATGFLQPARADLGPSQDVIKRSFDVQDALANERSAFTGAYDPTRANDIYGQQQGAISQLAQAAAGAAPSPAELMLQQQAAQNSARGFGLAAALQGRSPGGALRHALMNQQDVQAKSAQDAAALRAQEMATARGQLVQGLGGLQDQQLGTRAQDLGYRGQLLQGQIGALDAAGKAAGGYATASANDAASQNAFKGGLVNGLVGGFGGGFGRR